ncbi:MAG: ComEA family DNA-binding protein [Phycisphaerales bacterium]|nr:ComEA family DNA-binding protein [Phycisphaerales bacterium]
MNPRADQGAADSRHLANSPPSAGIHGPALWLGVGVVIGASLAGILLSYFRQAPMPMLTSGAGEPLANRVALMGSGQEPASGLKVGRRLDLNSASQAELELLPGVGATTAQRIIEHRNQRGGFKTVQELDRVKGVGPRLIERIGPLVSVGP